MADPGPDIARVLVALDLSSEPGSLLRAAADLAARLHVELHGLLIEDRDLERYAGLPFATEVRPGSAAPRSLDSGALERDLESRVRGLHRALAEAAGAHHLRWSLEVARRPAEAELRGHAERADVLVVSRSAGRTVVAREELGSTATLVVSDARHTVVVVEEASRLEGPPVVWIGAPGEIAGTLGTAARLATAGQTLEVVIQAPDPPAFEGLSARVKTWLAEHGRRARVEWLRRAELALLTHLVWQRNGTALVLAAATPLFERVSVGGLMQALGVPIVLVPSAAGSEAPPVAPHRPA